MKAGASDDDRSWLGYGCLVGGGALLALQISLILADETLAVPALVACSLGVVAWCLGCWVGLPAGTARRVLVSIAVLWLVGWLTITPSHTVRDPEPVTIVALVVGSLLCGFALLVVSVVPVNRLGTVTASTAWRLSLLGGAFAVPSSVRLLAGPEVATLLFVILTAVAGLLVFLIRPT